MNRTYAPACSAIGLVLGGFAVYAWTNNTVIAIIAAIVCAVVVYVIIRAIENAIDSATDKLAEKAADAYQKHKEKKNRE